MPSQHRKDPLVLHPSDLPLRVVLNVPSAEGPPTKLPYLLRYTRNGKMLLNRDESDFAGSLSR